MYGLPMSRYSISEEKVVASLRYWAVILLTVTLGLGSSLNAEARPDGKFPKPLRAQIDQSLGTHWYGVYVFGNKAGYAKMALSADDQGYVAEENVTLKIQAMGKTQKINMSALRRYDGATGALREVRSAFIQNDQEVRAQFVVEGLTGTLTQWVSGQKTVSSTALPRENIFDSIALYSKQRNGEVNNKVETYVFEALPPISKEIVMEHKLIRTETRMVDGVPLKLAVIKTTVPEQGINTRTLMRDDGVVLETEMMGMMKLRLEPKLE